MTLDAVREEHNQEYTCYFYETETDYVDESYYHFIGDSELIHPNLCFSKLSDDSFNEMHATDSYLLEIFDSTLPQYRLRYRLKQYVTYFDEELGNWEAGTFGDPIPTVLLVCANVADLIYAKRRARGLIAETWEKEDEDRPKINFTTKEKLKEYGILGDIWEKA